METIGKYEIVEELGRGGMGVVYRAYDPVMEREVAIKVVSDLMMAKPEMKDRFLREARTAGKLSHENITVVHDVGEEAGKPFIVMEYLGGEDLGHLIESRKSLTIQEKLDYAVQICRGLAFLHSRGVVHRDIKPANIRVVSGKIKIMDFGIARSATSELTKSGAIIGTPFYMSPEQIRGQKVDKRSDMFSFGVLLYELISGEKPFTGQEPTTIMYKIVHEDPPWSGGTMISGQSPLREMIVRLLAKNPEDRFGDLSEAVEVLERIRTSIRPGAPLREGRMPADRPQSPSPGPSGPEYAPTVPAGFHTMTAKFPPQFTSKGKTLTPRPITPRSRKPLYYAGGAVAVLIVAAALFRFVEGSPGKPHGVVALNILPWAEVLKVTNADKTEILLRKKMYTPCTLDLPEGSYEIQLINPALASSMSLDVQVTGGETQEIRRKFDSLDYQDLLTAIQQPDSTEK